MFIFLISLTDSFSCFKHKLTEHLGASFLKNVSSNFASKINVFFFTGKKDKNIVIFPCVHFIFFYPLQVLDGLLAQYGTVENCEQGKIIPGESFVLNGH